MVNCGYKPSKKKRQKEKLGGIRNSNELTVWLNAIDKVIGLDKEGTKRLNKGSFVKKGRKVQFKVNGLRKYVFEIALEGEYELEGVRVYGGREELIDKLKPSRVYVNEESIEGFKKAINGIKEDEALSIGKTVRHEDSRSEHSIDEEQEYRKIGEEVLKKYNQVDCSLNSYYMRGIGKKLGAVIDGVKITGIGYQGESSYVTSYEIGLAIRTEEGGRVSDESLNKLMDYLEDYQMELKNRYEEEYGVVGHGTITYSYYDCIMDLKMDSKMTEVIKNTI